MEYSFWKGAGGVPGDFSYGAIHIGSILIFLFVLIAVTFAGIKMSKNSQRKIVITAAVFSLVFEVFWRIIFFINKAEWPDLFPFYPCNIAGLLVPIIALTKNKTLKEMFYVFAFIGGIITFVYPQGVFTNQLLNFPILKSVLQHTAIIFIPVFEYATGNFKPKLKNYYLAIIGLFVHLFNSEYLPKLMGLKNTDYIFLHSGLPFTIEGVNQIFILAPIAFIVIGLFYMALDPKSTSRLFKKKTK